MPKQRLTDRQLISGVTLTDLLHFVVTGDTSQNPAGSSYKGNVEQLFGAFSAYTCSNPLTVDVVNACTSGITINGNVVINGSATTINTEVIQSKDNNIVLNYSGTHLTAIGGGITLEDGVSDGVDSRIFTNSDGIWLFDPGLSASTGTIDTLSACTGVYTSNLYGCSPLHIEPSGLNDVYIVENGGNVGIGTNTPTEKLEVSGDTKINGTLYINQPSSASTAEIPIFEVRVDDATSYFRLNNGSPTDGEFSPTIVTRQADSSGRTSTYIDSVVRDAEDISGATDVVRFRARRDGDFILNRDLYAWYNYTTRLMDLDKDGNLDIIQGGLRINTIGSGTPLINLGLDSSGNVVTGTTGSVSDIFVTGGTFDNNTDTITFTNTSGGTFDVTGITDTFVIAGTFNDTTNTLSLLRNDGNFVNVTGVTDTFTGNTSGTCITDLFVSNIHSCSPLNINPLDEGNVYFGSSSGVTIDVINKRFGINKSPEYPIDILGTDVQLLLDDTSTIKRLLMSGFSTDLVEYSARANLIGGLGGITMGSIPENAISPGIVPERGTSGDTYIYSSERANGLNIISKEGSGTDDYIRFYAGQDANGTTPDLYIQGSGVTRGFVGVNMDNPQFTLDVAGETRMSGSGQNILTIIGSGDTQPLFKVEGSSGELFSITDSLVGSLFSVNDISGLPILEVFDDDTVHMGSYQAPSLNTTVLLNPSTGLSTVYSIPMSAYTGAWFEYTVSNTGGARAGQIMSIFSGNTVNFTETTTTDIGTTSDVTFSMSADSTNTLLQVSATTSGWEVKTIVRSI